MKKILLAGTALVGMAVLSAPAHAKLDLAVDGYFRGYGVYADNNETTAGAGTSLRSFEFRKDSEIHFHGENALDNGLTVGFMSEVKLVGPAGAGQLPDEVYAYFSGGWGRVNFGQEDGAAFLLQVAAPSADSNIDGLRPQIGGLNTSVWDNHLAAGGPNRASAVTALTTYQVTDSRQTDRLTYLTPKFNGFQAGVSWAPMPGFATAGVVGMGVDNTANAFENVWDVAARWDGAFQGVGVSVGAGYTRMDSPNAGAAANSTAGNDDLDTWNAALNLKWEAFSLGGGYKWTNNGTNAAAGFDADTTVWFAGLGWDNGPYHLGASYLNGNADNGVQVLSAANGEVDYWQAVLGGGYTYGPGMTFRGAYKWGTVDNKVAAPISTDFQQATIGTDIQF